MVSPDSYGISRAPHYSGVILMISYFCLQDFHLLWFTFPDNSTNTLSIVIDNPTTPECKHSGLGYSLFAHHYLENLFDFFSFRYWDVSLPWVVLLIKEVPTYSWWVPPSDIHGYNGCRNLTVTFRILLRPLFYSYPRHPSYALKLDFILSRYIWLC